ncbi:hypothetical protein Fmac_000101 [Flemingia macrophylla]|uniref:Proline dehydrogenase n=1 Tax=Flemingia macrophylla TaxID=520843 RepID=A0ABD1NDF2_9FABA
MILVLCGGRGREGRRRAWQRSGGEAAEAMRMVEGQTSSPRPPRCLQRAGDDSLSPSPSPVLPQPTSVLRSAAADDLNFNDHHKLFSHLPTLDLLRSAAVLHATAIDPLVDFGTWLLRSNLMNVNSLREILLASLCHSFYNHFCIGEDVAATAKSIRALSRTGLRDMLVYRVKDTLDNHACDRNFHCFLHTVDVSRSAWSNWRCGNRPEVSVGTLAHQRSRVSYMTPGRARLCGRTTDRSPRMPTEDRRGKSPRTLDVIGRHLRSTLGLEPIDDKTRR